MSKFSRSLRLFLVISLMAGVAAGSMWFSTGVTANGGSLVDSLNSLVPSDVPDDPETLREKAKALAAEQQEASAESLQSSPFSADGPATNPLFAGVDDVAIPAVRINVTNSTTIPAFSGQQVWGAAYDPGNNKVYFNNGGVLLEWPVGGSVTTLGPMVDNVGASINFVGLAFSNGNLYGTRNIGNEAIYLINTTTRVATVHIDYPEAGMDCGGFEADPTSGAFYCANDNGATSALVRINANGSVTPITPYPAGSGNDIDGLAISPDRKAYLVTDDANGPIFVYDLIGGTFQTQLTAPWPTSEIFSAATWLVAGTGTPTPTATPTNTPTATPTNTPTATPTPTGQSLLLVPNTTTNTIVALDPQTGNLVNANFISIANLPAGAKTHAVLHSDRQRVLVSHQTQDVVYSYNLNGTFLGVFAPAGGVNTAIMDNVRGMAFHPTTGNFLVTSAGGGNTNAVVEFDLNGNPLGTFIAPGAGGIVGPWSILFRGTDVLVSASGDHIYRYQQNGTPNGRWNVEDVNFPQQIVQAANSNVLAAGFSIPSGVYEFTAAGSRTAIYNAVTANRGVYELPNGNILTSNGGGIHEITRGNVLVRTIIAGNSYMFSLAQLGAGPTPTPTATPTSTPTATPTNTPTATPTPTPTNLVQFSAASYVGDESLVSDTPQYTVVTVTRTGTTTGVTTVNVTRTGGTATVAPVCAAGVDAAFTSPTLVTFAAGETTKTFTIPNCPDTLYEADETILLSLTTPVGGGVGTQGTTTVIVNDTANQYRNTTPIDTFQGLQAAPYPSNITVTGGPTNVQRVRVTFFDLYHAFPDNLKVLLVNPQGRRFIIMGDAGGATPIPQAGAVTLTFTDLAGQVLPDNGPLTRGKFEPTTWQTTINDFPAPAPAGPYPQPGSTVGGTTAQTLFGNFGQLDGNGVWSLYVRDDNGGDIPSVINGQIQGGWGLELLAATAAGVEVSGRVTTPDGRGLRNAVVSMVDSQGVVRTATTSSFGYYSFDSIEAGSSVVMSVESRRYRFAPRVIQVIDTLTDVDFQGQE